MQGGTRGGGGRSRQQNRTSKIAHRNSEVAMGSGATNKNYRLTRGSSKVREWRSFRSSRSSKLAQTDTHPAAPRQMSRAIKAGA